MTRVGNVHVRIQSLDMNKKTNFNIVQVKSRILLTVFFSLALGVPLTIFSIYIIGEQAVSAISITTALLAIVTITCLIIVYNKERVIKKVFGSTLTM